MSIAPISAQLPRYSLHELLGEGAGGSVYRAHERATDRDVALKILRGGRSKEARARFRAEARSAAKLRHPNVVTVYGAGRSKHGDYLVMEYVDGPNLDELIQAGALGPHALSDVVAKIARGLEAVHAAGVLHRDVKPSNVVLDSDGEPRLVDFGLAAPSAESTARAAGTLRYMAPEILAGGQPSFQSDVYALGLTLYEGLSRTRPDPGVEPAVIAARIDELTGAARGIRTACLGALAVDPAKRCSAGELAHALEQALRPEDASTRRLAVGVAAGLIGVVAIVGLATRRHAEPADGSGQVAAAASEVVAPVLSSTPGSTPRFVPPPPQRIELAERPATAVLERPPELAAHVRRARTRILRKDFRGCVEDCERALQLDPDCKEALLYVGESRLRLGQPEAGIAALTRLIRLDPKHADALVARAMVYIRCERYSEAIADCDRLLELEPESYSAYQNRGIARMQRGEVKLAIGDFTRAAKLDPRDADSLTNRGVAELSQRDPQALVSLSAAIERDPRSVRATYTRGLVREMLKDNQGAVRDFTRAIALDPGHMMAFVGRGRSHQRLRRRARAAADYRRALELLGPQDPRRRIVLRKLEMVRR